MLLLFFKQKTAFDMRISDWSSDVCSSDLQFVYFEGQMPLYAQVREVSGKTAALATLRDYTHGKNNVWGITARNREQNFALNLLMNPDCDFVSLLGQAGTGKTLLALAAGITQETGRASCRERGWQKG